MITSYSTPLAQDAELLTSIRELCFEMVDRPGFVAHRKSIEVFMASPEARELFEKATDLQISIRDRQEEGEIIPEDELDTFEELRSQLLDNDIARAFLEAQEDLKNTEALLHLYVTRTLQLGKLPTEEELMPEGGCGCSSGSCSSGSCSEESCEGSCDCKS
jgi:cell fate (sporulation/competence/biofilm development) regulator YlbF (YheA/YmcA/DUF963 family)